MPARGLSDVTRERLLAASAEHGCSVWAAMKKAEVRVEFQPRAQQAIEAFVELIEDFSRHLDNESTELARWASEFFSDIYSDQ